MKVKRRNEKMTNENSTEPMVYVPYSARPKPADMCEQISAKKYDYFTKVRQEKQKKYLALFGQNTK
jgi:hypothetical protein